MRVSDKVALVTGGAGGIGAACAVALAREGATVFTSDIQPEPATGSKDNYFRHDVTSADDWTRVVGEIIARHGRLDIFVHCAGIEGSHTERGLATSEAEWNRVIGINLTGTFLGTRIVMEEMLKTGRGSIILLSSAATDKATASSLAYGTSKAGMTHLAKSFAAIGARDGAKVRCNSVHPGSIKSRMSDSLFAAIAKTAQLPVETVEANVCQAIPFGERGMPEDVANLALYLASDEARYVTGSQFKVDGGWTLHNIS